jgi:hypothetical protein
MGAGTTAIEKTLQARKFGPEAATIIMKTKTIFIYVM